MRHQRFEWDERKAQANLRKHGVSFDDAVRVLQDPFADWFHLERPDLDAENRSGEERWVTLGTNPFNRNVIVNIVWTICARDDGPTTRIISARLASRTEQREYEEAIY